MPIDAAFGHTRAKVSAGIAELFVHGTTIEELLHMADMALYRAKNEGRNQVQVAEQPRN